MGIVHGNSSPITTDHHESVHIFSMHQYLQFAQTHENMRMEIKTRKTALETAS